MFMPGEKRDEEARYTHSHYIKQGRRFDSFVVVAFLLRAQTISTKLVVSNGSITLIGR